MAMIYGLNYSGSSLVGPTWACAPGMQTGGLQGHLCPRGREEEGVGAAWQAPASVEEVRWRRRKSHPWEAEVWDGRKQGEWGLH